MTRLSTRVCCAAGLLTFASATGTTLPPLLPNGAPRIPQHAAPRPLERPQVSVDDSQEQHSLTENQHHAMATEVGSGLGVEGTAASHVSLKVSADPAPMQPPAGADASESLVTKSEKRASGVQPQMWWPWGEIDPRLRDAKQGQSVPTSTTPATTTVTAPTPKPAGEERGHGKHGIAPQWWPWGSAEKETTVPVPVQTSGFLSANNNNTASRNGTSNGGDIPAVSSIGTPHLDVSGGNASPPPVSPYRSGANNAISGGSLPPSNASDSHRVTAVGLRPSLPAPVGVVPLGPVKLDGQNGNASATGNSATNNNGVSADKEKSVKQQSWFWGSKENVTTPQPQLGSTIAEAHTSHALLGAEHPVPQNKAAGAVMPQGDGPAVAVLPAPIDSAPSANTSPVVHHAEIAVHDGPHDEKLSDNVLQGSRVHVIVEPSANGGKSAAKEQEKSPAEVQMIEGETYPLDASSTPSPPPQLPAEAHPPMALDAHECDDSDPNCGTLFLAMVKHVDSEEAEKIADVILQNLKPDEPVQIEQGETNKVQRRRRRMLADASNVTDSVAAAEQVPADCFMAGMALDAGAAAAGSTSVRAAAAGNAMTMLQCMLQCEKDDDCIAYSFEYDSNECLIATGATKNMIDGRPALPTKCTAWGYIAPRSCEGQSQPLLDIIVAKQLHCVAASLE